MTQSGLLVKETHSFSIKIGNTLQRNESSPFNCSSQLFLVILSYQVSPGLINQILNYYA